MGGANAPKLDYVLCAQCAAIGDFSSTGFCVSQAESLIHHRERFTVRRVGAAYDLKY